MLSTRAICLAICLLGIAARASGYYRPLPLPPTDPATNSAPGDYIQPGWFHNQKLDHFNASETRTWSHRYFTNTENYRVGGPVFLFINGESEANPGWLTTGQWTKFAKQHNALQVILEHRFYGESQPTDDLSPANLLFLNSEQALADTANIIGYINEQFGLATNSTKWIAFGGSYAGMLAAWLRLEYPDVIHGAVSSSAPIEPVWDYSDYFVNVGHSLAAYDPACPIAIGAAFQQVKDLLNTTYGPALLTEQLQLCTPVNITNELEIITLYDAMASQIAFAVQFSGIAGDFWIGTGDVCDIMLTNQTLTGLTPVQLLGQVNAAYNAQNGYPCVDYGYDAQIAEAAKTSWTAPYSVGGARQWIWQTCTAFGLYQTSNSTLATAMFAGDLFTRRFFAQQCEKIFYADLRCYIQKADVAQTNAHYGGKSLQTTNVIYVQGSEDPFAELGLTQSPNANMPVVYIQGTAHCADMYSDAPYNPPQLTAARLQVGAFVSGLLA